MMVLEVPGAGCIVAGTVLRVVMLVWYTPNMTRSGMLIGKFKLNP